MSSLRSASPKLRNYFRENYIPQVYEVLEPLGGELGERGIARIFRGGAMVWWAEREWRESGAE